jgi:hypothetical protein
MVRFLAWALFLIVAMSCDGRAGPRDQGFNLGFGTQTPWRLSPENAPLGIRSDSDLGSFAQFNVGWAGGGYTGIGGFLLQTFQAAGGETLWISYKYDLPAMSESASMAASTSLELCEWESGSCRNVQQIFYAAVGNGSPLAKTVPDWTTVAVRFPASSTYRLTYSTSFGAAPGTSGSYSAMSALHVRTPGDATQDGRLSREDVKILLANFGREAAAWRDGDFDGDRSVSLADLAFMQGYWGTTVAASPVPVPEPKASALAFGGAVILAMREVYRRVRKPNRRPRD